MGRNTRAVKAARDLRVYDGTRAYVFYCYLWNGDIRGSRKRQFLARWD